LKLGSDNETIVVIGHINQRKSKNEALKSNVKERVYDFLVVKEIVKVNIWIYDIESLFTWVENDPHVM
jgi:hypothetical protein